MQGSAGKITVDYYTADETACEGEDYEAVSGTLVFGPGETEQTILVPIRSSWVSLAPFRPLTLVRQWRMASCSCLIC